MSDSRQPGQDVERDERFMRLALAAAADAMAKGEVPVGAVVVIGDEVVAVASNAPITNNDPTAHAEVLAIRAAAGAIGNYRMPGASVYVTVEPCAMCVGAMAHARIGRVIFGCSEPKTGALGSRMSLESAREIGFRGDVRAGVIDQAARELLQRFFKSRRGA